ncbi:MAG: hypothetical protein JO159_04805 [Acidobacteria bacterium]|nr:hypothetical protein [Acidobacteriota bacterium]
MVTEPYIHSADDRSFSFSLRELVAVGFRRKRVVALCFCGVLLGAGLAALLQPSEYRASTRFLIERDRMDPVVSPGQDPQVMVRPEITEEELNSEVELLESDDVLRQVVVSCGLHQRKSWLRFLIGQGQEPERIAKAVARLQKELQIEAVKKSNLIQVTYRASDPQLAARVLRSLDDAYIQKSLSVHRPPGRFEFFDQETERYRKNLVAAEAQLKAFSSEESGVAPHVARDITLQKLGEFHASLQQIRAEIAASERRIGTLESQATGTPERLTTQTRTIDDAQVLQGLKNTLMNLELKRTELLTKYQPDYPLVQEVDKQLADTRASIGAEESKPLREETTDENPTYSWINQELAKAKAERSALQARAVSIQNSVSAYAAKARDLEQKGIVQGDLLREVKTDEDNYLLYQRKREEARMTDALDRTHIFNVAIAEQPSVPTLPTNSRWLVILVGILLATVVSLMTAFTLEFLDPSFRTPSEVVTELQIPVLASIPKEYSQVIH